MHPTYKELQDQVRLLKKKVAENRLIAQSLKESEENFRLITESTILGICQANRSGKLIFVNEAFADLVGYKKEELLGHFFTIIIPEKYIPNAIKITKDAIFGKRRKGEFFFQHKNAKKVPINFTMSALVKRGKIVGFSAIVEDITDRVKARKAVRDHKEYLLKTVRERTFALATANEKMQQEIDDRKKIENALAESEKKYRLLFNHANDAIFIAQDNVLKFTNPKTRQILGYSRQEIERQPFVNFIHPEDRHTVFKSYMRGVKGETTASTFTFRALNRSRNEIWVQINSTPVMWESKPATLNFVRDITRLKELELQLIQSQKMEAVGTLASGIAHNFNNLLMTIQGNTSLMLLNIDPTHQNYSRLKTIEKYVDYGSDLSNRLLGFAREGKYESKSADFNQLIQNCVKMFTATKKELTILENLQQNLWPVSIDYGQMEQVLLNLLVNAWQAMPDGGEIRVRTQNIELSSFEIGKFQRNAGKYVKISISDTGIGMDKATQSKVFEPFFTTKEVGKGTGLGLASVYGIVKNHEGFITVHSRPSRGATFHIYLPLSVKLPSREEKQTSDALLRGTETVLVVDDEPMILETGEAMLEELGYTVVTADSGDTAIRLVKDADFRFGLIILDMIMPNMDGYEACRQIKRIRPEAKIMLSSGNGLSAESARILEQGFNGFIQKPFNPSSTTVF